MKATAAAIDSTEDALTMLDLCSGIGGMTLGAALSGVRTVAFAEIEPFCCELLSYRFPGIPNLGDVYGISTDTVERLGRIDIVAAGYPCQPTSHAGKRRGQDDARWLWPEVYRIIRLARPTWIVFENVAGHITLGLDDVLDDLAGRPDHEDDECAPRYEAWPLVFPAQAVGAPHQRERVFIVGHATSDGRERRADIRDRRHVLPFAERPTAQDCAVGTERKHRTRPRGGIGVGQADANGNGWDAWRAERAGQEWQTASLESRRMADSDGDGQQQPRGHVGEERGWAGDGGEIELGDTTSARLSQWRSTGIPETASEAVSGMVAQPQRSGVAHTKRQRRGGLTHTASGDKRDGQAARWQEGASGPEQPSDLADASKGGWRAGQRLLLSWLGQSDLEGRGGRQAQSRLGRATHGLSEWWDRHPWPAGPAEAQHAWEAARVTQERIPRRAARLKALGNAIVPAQVAPIFAAIVETEAEQQMRGDN